MATFPGDNGRIAYTDDDGSIHTVLPSGHGDQTIQPDGFQVAWSPSGKRIAFVGGSGPDLYTARADGSSLRRLTFDGDNFNPSYSPGGGRIVFNAEAGITTIRGDGSDRRLILDSSKGGNATWSPGGEIAYLKGGGIWTMRPNGTHRNLLIGNASGPIYSPDGGEFLFSRPSKDDDAMVRHLLANADGSNVRKPPCKSLERASTNPAGGLFPTAYSPDGGWLLVASPNMFPQTTANLVRLSLGSCTGTRVVGRVAWAGADWQPLP
jgi:Tol biopolymer transport system component